MDAINGITLEVLADIMTKEGELRAKFGQQEGRAEFGRYMAERGIDPNTFSQAHNGWQERFRADPTGMLQAQFHQMLSQRTMAAHFGDVADMSQEQVEGVTLDTYAQICVAMGKPGIDADEVARSFGLADAARWVTVNGAWAAKMKVGAPGGINVLTTQFGTLYQKYAGPAFAQQQLEHTAALLAKSNEPRDVVKTPEADLTQPTLLAKLRSDSQKERWEAARWLAHQWKKGDPGTQANLACIPVLLEILERHDEHTVGNAEGAIRKLTKDLEQYTDDVKSSAARCLGRAREKLATLEAAFAPIRDKAVPERITMQSRIQDYQSLVETLQDTLNDWPAQGKAAGGPNQQAFVNSAVVPGARMAAGASAAKTSGGFPKGLIAIPIVLGVAFTLWRAFGGSHAAATESLEAGVAAASASAPAMAAASAVAPVVPAAHAVSPPAHVGKEPKHKH